VKVSDVTLPVVANLTADYERSADEIRTNLAAQIDHPVRWEETIGRLVADGFDTFVEVGPGTVLAGLMKRLAPGLAVHSVGDTVSLQATVAALAQRSVNS